MITAAAPARSVGMQPRGPRAGRPGGARTRKLRAPCRRWDPRSGSRYRSRALPQNQFIKGTRLLAERADAPGYQHARLGRQRAGPFTGATAETALSRPRDDRQAATESPQVQETATAAGSLKLLRRPQNSVVQHPTRLSRG